jgi:hypothetical protein
MYDIIGDIHGHAEALKQLLNKMDYKENNGVWQHPQRKAIFVGDYIDRGPAIRETLSIVKNMQQNDQAIALMGNHEYNALAYAYKTKDGEYLRKHNEKNNKQHAETLKQFEEYKDEWQLYLDWFYTLPLFLDLPELRAVHACWDDEHIEWLKEKVYKTMTEDLLVASHVKHSKAYEVIEDTLKGKEFDVPGHVWYDKDGHPRSNNRIKWWKDPAISPLGECLFNCPDSLKEEMMQKGIKAYLYPPDAPPVFFGHYWMEDAFPVIQSHNVICLDYSVAKEGSLVAYRWNGEKEVDGEHFVSVKSN